MYRNYSAWCEGGFVLCLCHVLVSRIVSSWYRRVGDPAVWLERLRCTLLSEGAQLASLSGWWLSRIVSSWYRRVGDPAVWFERLRCTLLSEGAQLASLSGWWLIGWRLSVSSQENIVILLRLGHLKLYCKYGVTTLKKNWGRQPSYWTESRRVCLTFRSLMSTIVDVPHR